ncbi:MAG TPA: ABC transporter substrate-binding protein [Anaerolineae bacterium]|nr:ABC transporter substrate-binding protein [Anaerolineae bacterium]HQI83236.1 ABC transporter substrate-binding protein [Anaerolineae bacterium]
MNHKIRFVWLLVSLMVALVVIGLGALLLRADSPAVAQNAAALNAAVIALGQEPTSLYVYGDDFSLDAAMVRNALMDGPFTNVDFGYQTTILTRVPRWEDGDITLQPTAVVSEDLVVAENGSVVTLTVGTMIRPSGCRGHACAVVFDGSPVQMDRMVVTSTLRNNVRWSDGVALTAQDAVFGQQIACDPDSPADKVMCDVTASYVEADPYTTVWASLPGYWSHTAGLVFWTPLPYHVLGGMTALDIFNGDYGRAPLGWGPFRITEWISGSHITLERNPYYWRLGYPKLDQVTFRFMGNSAEIYDALQRGEIHLASQTTLVASDYITDMLNPPVTSTVELLWTNHSVWEHTDFGILPADSRYIFFDDPQVRRAVAYALDRQRIINEAWYGLGTPLNSYVPDTHPLYKTSFVTYPYSPTLAADLLTAAGWVDTNSNGIRDKGGQEFVITYSTTTAPQRIQAGLIVAENLAAVGIDVVLDFQPPAQFFADGPEGPVFGRKFDLANFAWNMTEPSCDLYVTWQIPAEATGWKGNNDTGYSNPAYDAACEQALAAWPGTPDYVQGHQAAMQILSEDVPMVPIFNRLKMAAASTAFFVGPDLDPTELVETWNIWAWTLGTPDTVAVGLVTDGPTVEDKSFNALSYAGILRAERELGIVSRIYTSASEEDYAPNLQQCALDGNTLCIGVSFLMADAISQTAALYPGTTFALVDMAWETTPPNLRGMTFAEDQAGYLAGTLAALMSSSRTIGAVGGIPLPPVVRFIDGYRNGAQCAAPATTVLVTYTNTFSDPELGARAAQELLAQGVDVVFNVAGGTGSGAILTATQSGAWAIGVDTDQYLTVFEGGGVPGSDRLLSSAMKRMDNAVFDTISDVISGTFTSGTVLYTVAEDGVGLAPFHETDPLIPVSVRSRLSGVAQGLREGWLNVYGPCVATIGVAADLSGPASQYGWPQVNAVQLAISQTNAAGGLNLGGMQYLLHLAVADDGCDGGQAAPAAQSLLDAGALAVVGHTCSVASIPAQAVYATAGVPMISPSSTNPNLTQQGYTTTFRTVSHDASPAHFLATYFRQVMGYTRSVIVTEPGSQWLRDVYSNTFTALGGVVTRDWVLADTFDFTATLLAIQPENPDVIFVAGYAAAEPGQLSRTAYNLGMGNIPIAWDSMSEVPMWMYAYLGWAGNAAAEGDFIAMHQRPFWGMPGWTTFVNEYEAANFVHVPDDPGTFAAFAYDAVNMLFDALTRANVPAPSAARDALAATSDFMGVVGTYQGFDGNGDVIPQWSWIERYQNGAWSPVFAVPELSTELRVCLSGCPYASVQAAVDAASDGDVIKVAAGTYTGVSAREGVTQVVYIDKNVTIQGGYSTSDWTTSDPETNITTLDAQGQGRVFFVIGGKGTVIDGLHITGGDAHGQPGAHLPSDVNGSSGGGMYVFGNIDPAGEKFILTNNHIYGNTARQGGGVYMGFCCNVAIVQGNTFATNSADEAGGGLAIHASGATFVDNLFAANSAENGGGFSTAAVGGGVFTRCTFINNHARGLGGGLALETAATLHETLIISNTADERGGGVGFFGSNPFSPYASFNNTVIAENQSGIEGAGVFGPSGIAVHMLHTTLARNGGGDGSGMSIGELNPDEPAPSTVVMTNTILDSQDIGIRVVNDSVLTVNGILWHNTPVTLSQSPTALVSVQNQITGDPAFLTGGDYHIGATSAARDAGVDSSVYVDIDGQPRPMGLGYDIGADEYPGAHLALRAGTPATLLLPGQTFTYSVALANDGALTATGTVLTFALDPQQRAVGVTPGGMCALNGDWGGVTVCPLGALPPGAEVAFVVTAQVAPTVPKAQTMWNVVQVTADALPTASAGVKTISRAQLVYPLSYDLGSLDVNREAYNMNSLTLLAQLLEAPYRYGTDGSLIPAGATGYTVSSDGLVYTVTLRADARWSDGLPVTAQHYVDTIIRALDPAAPAEYAYLLYIIQGAQAFNTGVSTDPATVGVAALDEFTLRFTLHSPAAFFPSVLATSVMYPIRLDVLNTLPFVGNGPYRLQEREAGRWFLLDKNPFYHSAGDVVIPRILLAVIPQEAQVAAYRAGLLDASEIPGAAMGGVLNDPLLSGELRSVPWPGVFYIGLNNVLTPTNALAVRQALASAVDRAALLTTVSMPWRTVATSVIPTGIPGYQNGAVGYSYNPTQARAYLAAAGYPGGVGFPGVELWTTEGGRAVAEAVAANWRSVLGINVTVVYQPNYGALFACQAAPGECSYHAYRLGWIMDYGDANNILNDVFHPNSTYQYTGWDNARFRELMTLQMNERDPAQRTAYFQEADRILVQDAAAVIPLYYNDRVFLIKPNVAYEYPSIGGPRLMTWNTSGAAIPCYVRVSSLPGITYNDLQSAIDAAQPGDTLKVAGTCSAVHSRPAAEVTPSGVVTQVAYIAKSLVLQGGYTTTNWLSPNPVANPTTLDARALGRVFYITGAVEATLGGFRITGGDATGLGGVPWGWDAGGGVYAISATVTLNDNRIAGNYSPYLGGGVFLRDGAFTLNRNTITANNAGWGGGALFWQSNVALNGNTIAANAATTAGGGIAAWGYALTLNGDTIIDNMTSGDGGGLAGGAAITLINTRIAANRAVRGGGLYVDGRVHLLHNTIVGNTSSDGSSIYVTTDPMGVHSTVALTNTIVAQSSVGISVTGGNTVTINGILWHATPITVSQSSTATVTLHRQVAGDPLFDADGYHLRIGSPAIDAGVPVALTRDIDRDPRPYGSGFDLGADEAPYVTVPPETGATLVYTNTAGVTTTLAIPPAAVTTTTTIVLTQLDPTTVAPPPELAAGGIALKLDAYLGDERVTNFTFNAPVTLTLAYTDADVAGIDESTLRLYRYVCADPESLLLCVWEIIGTRPGEGQALDTANNILTAWLTGFTRFGGMGVSLQPALEVSKTYSGNRVAGTPVTYTLTVANTGNADATGVTLEDVVPQHLTWTSGGTLLADRVRWYFEAITATGGIAEGQFSAFLPCTASLAIVNAEYRVVSSAQGVTSTVGPAVSFTVISPTIAVGINYTPAAPIAGEAITFTATATTNGTPLSYAWSLGGTGPSATHTYTEAGRYTVTVTATDGCGYAQVTEATFDVKPAGYRVYLPLVMRQ